MKKLLTIFLLVVMAGGASAQDPIEIKDISGFGSGKFKKSPKKIYIAQFRVNFQLLFSQVETAQGGSTLGGGYRGDAQAGLTMAVKGVSSEDLQEITDKLYQDYIAKIKSAGYELVTADEASSAKEFDGWERKMGGKLNEAQYPGYITATPTGFEYYAKKTKADGREKSTFTDNTLKISNNVKATAIKVNIVVPFVEDAESGASKALGKTIGGLAKVVLRPYLRVEKDIVGTSGTFSTDAAVTKVTYAFMEGMGTQAISNLQLKDDIAIPGIFEDKKYKAIETADQDLWGTEVGALIIFNVTNNYLSKTQPLPCDATKYKEGVISAAGKYLDLTLTEYLSNMK